MSVSCTQIIESIEKLANPNLAENWDNIGLQVGSREQKVNKIMLVLDVEDSVVQRAIENNVDMIITHHPLTLKTAIKFSSDTWLGKILYKLNKNDIAVYSAHTNLDIANLGVCDVLAKKMNILKTKPLVECDEKMFKLAVFVPDSFVTEVISAITVAGAGETTNYSECCFQTNGIGQFKPLSTAKPFVGNKQELTKVSETRIETTVKETVVKKVVKAMKVAHPYEEVAFDLIELKNSYSEHGLGKIGQLPRKMSRNEFIKHVKASIGIDYLTVGGWQKDMVHMVAVIGGSSATFSGRAKAMGADVLVCGDMKYHDAQEAYRQRMMLIDAGHFATEATVMEYLCEYLRNEVIVNKWKISTTDIFVDEDHVGYMKIC